MNTWNSRRLVLVAALTLGAGVATPSFAAKEKPTAVRQAVVTGSDETIPFSAVPDKARGELDRVRGKDKVISTEKVVYPGGRTVFRCTMTAKNGVRIVRVSVGGSLLNQEFVRQADVAVFEKNPAAFHKAAEESRASREAAEARADAVVTATADKPEKIEWNQIPGRVRATFMRESAGEKIDYIIRYRDNGSKNVLYQANIPMGGGKVHMVQIVPSGKIFNEAAFTTSGGGATADLTVTTLTFHEAPAAVQDSVNKAAPSGTISQVDMVKRHGRDIYTIEIPSTNALRFLTVEGNGKILSDDTENF